MKRKKILGIIFLITFFYYLIKYNISVPSRSFREICANSSEGMPLINRFKETIEIKIHTSGNWKIDPIYPKTSSNGINDVFSPQNVLPSAPYGALIIKRSNGNYEYIGDNNNIKLASQEVIFFLANDKPNSYTDNSGCIIVELKPKFIKYKYHNFFN